MIKKIFYPDGFSFGSDVEKCLKIDENTFYKKFKKNKYDSYIKTLFILNLLKDEIFVPKVIKTNNLELYISYCGNLVKTNNLPNDWESQLINVKKTLQRHKIIFRDWGPWELNPYVINNICLKDDQLYFIDFGDTQYAEKDFIEDYFNRKIRSIKLVLNYGYLYLLFHYVRRFIIMIWRKLKRPYNLLLLYFICQYLKFKNFL